MKPILVAGTGSWTDDDRKPDWFWPHQPFGDFLVSEGIQPTYDDSKPFIWSTSLAGVPWFTNKREWAAGGAALAYFIIATLGHAPEETTVICHSHGLQVVLYACAEHGLKIRTLISVGSPVRMDMMDEAETARKYLNYWLHIHSDKTDYWQWFGEMFDGNWKKWWPGGEPRIVREHPLADKNDFVPGVGHSELLRDPSKFHFWNDKLWLEKLR